MGEKREMGNNVFEPRWPDRSQGQESVDDNGRGSVRAEENRLSFLFFRHNPAGRAEANAQSVTLHSDCYRSKSPASRER